VSGWAVDLAVITLVAVGLTFLEVPLALALVVLVLVASFLLIFTEDRR
jgi:uncharacterized membrane protein YiaA